MKKRVIILSLLMTFCVGCKSTNPNVFSIGSARVSSNYYFVANAIAENASQAIDGMTFTAVETNGSEDNVRGVVTEKYQLAITQADMLSDAVNAEGIFADDSPITNLRAIAGLYPEAVQIVTRKDLEMNTLPGLWGATISVGDQHSGTEQNAFQVLLAGGLNENKVNTVNMSTKEAAEALKNGEIDAFFYTSGTPSGIVEDLAEEVEISLIPIDGEIRDTLLGAHDYFESCVIPAGTYKGQDEDIETISIMSVLITNENTDPDVIEAVTRSIFENRDRIRSSVKIAFDLDEASAVSHIPVPFHDGAKAYYSSKGISAD
ncbi:MAG: TAXI family TRAP transporter solute-binding subunit [Solobacterium sp.]|nr:TAXI family TRAP transporter solute-binding subunit [Solobacterium sp.]